MSPTMKAEIDEAHDDAAYVYVIPTQESWHRAVDGEHTDAHGRRWTDKSAEHRAHVAKLRAAACN